MLEDHSPTSRSNSRKPFRRKGAKTVLFNNSCVYYQLESIYDSSDADDEDRHQEEPAVDEQPHPLDKPPEPEFDTEDRGVKRIHRQRTDFVDLDDTDQTLDQASLSPRIDIETMDVAGSLDTYPWYSLLTPCRL